MTVYITMRLESMLDSNIYGVHAACKNNILLISIDHLMH